MKHIKTFSEINEGKGRIKIVNNQVHTGDADMPQFWSTKPDYTEVSKSKSQEIGFDPKQLVSISGSGYNYLNDSDDHIDDKEIRKLVEPHVKNFNDFGITPK